MSRVLSFEEQGRVSALLLATLEKHWRGDGLRWTGDELEVVWANGFSIELESVEFHAMSLERHVIQGVCAFLRDNKCLPWTLERTAK
jgi:hypothetical protein